MADEQRIEVLEQHVRALYEQIGALRAELKGASSAPASPAAPVMREAAVPREPTSPPPPHPQPVPPRATPPAPPRPNPAPRRAAPRPQPDVDFEKLFGRYGTIAVASLAILMGVGTFLSWAIEHGHLGPTVRVILGFIGAGIVAAFGIWVREKRDKRFGNVLLALALAIVHVDAWAAGPHLQVLSTFAALAIAATASIALAALALTSEERTLFAVGFVGALIAPFVTASEPGSIVLLLTYGWVVIAASLLAIREKGWDFVLGLTVFAATTYVLAAVGSGPGSDHSWLAAHAPVMFAFACAAAALLFARGANRSRLGLAFLLLASFATFGYSLHARQLEVSISLFGTVAAYLIARELETDQRWLAIGNVVIPLSFLFATIASASDRTIGAMAAAALTVIAALLAWEDEEERAQHLLVAAIASWIAIVVYLIDFDTRCIAALALHAALFSIILRSSRARLLAPPIALGLMLASGWSFILLDGRALYRYTPFLTIPSACALACVGAWAIFAYALKPTAGEKSLQDVQLSAVMSAIAIIIAFFWVRQELVGAWSSDAASFALIVYYALAGLTLIHVGRIRGIGLLRGAGLALAFYAGYKTLVETFTIDAIGLRVGARILVGVFLAAVAYWYRVPSAPGGEGEIPSHEPAGAEPAVPSA